MRMRRFIGRFGFLSLSLILAACGDSEKPLPADFMALREREPVSESFNMRYKYTIEGHLKAILEAPHIYEQPKPLPKQAAAGPADVMDDAEEPQAQVLKTYTVADSGVRIEFYDDRGAVESNLRANRAEMYNEEGYAISSGNVVVTNVKGDKLETERLRWDRNKNNISTDRFVKITTADEIIMGDSMVANTDFTQYKIFKIRGIIKLRE